MAKARGYVAPVLLDSAANVKCADAVFVTPTVFLITPSGLIVGRAPGMRECSGATGRAVLKALLREQK
ncbi:MAG: hypothetical protein ACE5JN_05995 [Candidatus Methylomirabilia bacterium]